MESSMEQQEQSRSRKGLLAMAGAAALALAVAGGGAAWWAMGSGAKAPKPQAAETAPVSLAEADLLFPGDAIMTRVVDVNTGEPLSKCEMKLSTALREAWVPYETTDGLVTLSKAAKTKGPVTLRLRAPGYCATEVKILYSNLPDGMRKRPFDVALEPLRAGEGYVFDKETGQPIEDVYVRLLGSGEPVVRGQVYPVDETALDRTDEEGHFFLEGYGDASASHLLLWHLDYPIRIVSDFGAEEDPMHTITYSKGGGLTVYFHNEGTPPAGLAPELWLVAERGVPAVPVPDPVVMNAGRFSVAPLAAGAYVVRLVYAEDGSEWGRAPLLVAEGKVTHEEWDLAQFGGVWGTVPNAGEVPVREVEIALAQRPDCPVYSSPLNEAGEFEFGFLPTGAYIISVWRKDQAFPYRQPHNVHPGEWAELEVKAPG